MRAMRAMRAMAFSVCAVCAMAATSSCFDVVRCSSDDACPTTAPFCVDGACAVHGGDGAGEGEGGPAEGEGAPGEGEGAPGEGEGGPGEGEGAGGEGEGAGPDCREVPCPSDQGCVDDGTVDVGVCVPPPNTPAACQETNQFFAREAGAPWIWRPLFVDKLTPPSSSAYGCSSSENAVLFNFDWLDDEDNAGHHDSPVTVRHASGTTTPPPANVTTQFTGRDGHVGTTSVAVCLLDNFHEFAFAFDDDLGDTSNAVCITVP